jgi:hypothetical protein
MPVTGVTQQRGRVGQGRPPIEDVRPGPWSILAGTRRPSVATVICQAAPLAVRLSKQLVRAGVVQGEDELWALQAELGAALRRSEDFLEGPRAFIDKRAPQWKGR